MKLCTDCKFYEAGAQESTDVCLHPRAETGGVRMVTRHKCAPMRAGICGKEAELFALKEMEAVPA